MERRGRLTYERLVKSLERLQGAIDAQFLEQEDSGRVTDLHHVINDALLAARAGMGGTAIASPVQLKRHVEARIVEVHERHNSTEEREEHTATASNTDRNCEHMAPLTAHDLKTSPNYVAQENSRLVRTSRSPDSGKENAVPAAAPTRNTSMKKPCAVKKTAIAKRATSKRPSTASIKKRASTRTNRSKPKVPLSIASSLPATDEADRRAAAAALLGLSEQSPNKPLVTAPTPSSSDMTSRTKGKKRAHSVYRDGISPAKLAQSQDQIPPQLHESSSPVLEQATLMPSIYAPVPTLDLSVNVQQSFLLGVEYAIQQVSRHLPSSEVNVVAELSEFVMRELGLQGSSDCDKALDVHHCSEEGDIVAQDAESGSKNLEWSRDAGKGFWDVI